MTTPSAQRPIFIVGCHRSGTTLLRLIVDSHPHLSCGPETRFLADFEKVTGENWPRMERYGFPKEYWYGRFAELFHNFHMEYAQRRGKRRWADKTPLYSMHLDFINKLYPTSQFVHVVRDGRDVVASHRDRFGYWSALKAVEKWPRYIREVRRFGGTLCGDRYLEVHYEDVVNQTEPTLRKLLDYLGEPWDDAVLAHDSKPHDVGGQYPAFSSSRRQAAGRSGAVYRSRVGSHRREIDPLLRTLCKLRSQRVLSDLGYS